MLPVEKWTDPPYPAATLFNWSSAVTVKLKGEPKIATVGADTTKCVAAPPPTAMAFEYPLMAAFDVSVALMVCNPAVFSVAWYVPTPSTKMRFNGRMAFGSLLVKCKVPE